MHLTLEKMHFVVKKPILDILVMPAIPDCKYISEGGRNSVIDKLWRYLSVPIKLPQNNAKLRFM